MLEYSSISSGQAWVIFRWDICFVNLVLLSGSLILAIETGSQACLSNPGKVAEQP